MEEKEKSRLSSITAIITQLQSKKIITASYLTEKHKVSVRTIYRDILTIERSGIPVVTEEGKGYFLMKGYQLPPVLFTEDEANALITAEQLVLKNKNQSFVPTGFFDPFPFRFLIKSLPQNDVLLLRGIDASVWVHPAGLLFPMFGLVERVIRL